MSSYRDELARAYHAEVYGEAIFAAMAAAVEQPERSAQLGLLALIERETKEQLAPLCDREGIPRDDEPLQAKGRALAERAASPNWDYERFLRGFAPLTAEALLRYRVMRDVLAPESGAPTMRSLIRHEEVLQTFADGILAGDDAAARPLLAALEGDHRSAADELLERLATRKVGALRSSRPRTLHRRGACAKECREGDVRRQIPRPLCNKD